MLHMSMLYDIVVSLLYDIDRISHGHMQYGHMQYEHMQCILYMLMLHMSMPHDRCDHVMTWSHRLMPPCHDMVASVDVTILSFNAHLGGLIMQIGAHFVTQ